MRHDWNSLISDDESLRFSLYSKDFFPDRLLYVKYLNDFEKRIGLNVIHNTDVRNVVKVNCSESNNHKFMMSDQHGNTFLCRLDL